MVTLSIIYKLFKQVQSLQQDNAREVTELLEQSLQDIKQENRELEHTLAATGNDTKPAGEKESSKQPETEGETKNPYTPETDSVTDETALSLEAKILQLHDKGFSIEEIARQHNCGHTEAELIIKMNQKAYNNT
ncbi:DUF6115 domain-containing protein [Lentibacillus kimchii]|uniref:DUF6115 domain-containing protein n=1 Tax=Lentibacillus kimchii TaxID=1542911 RepID=UPI0036D22190